MSSHLVEKPKFDIAGQYSNSKVSKGLTFGRSRLLASSDRETAATNGPLKGVFSVAQKLEVEEIMAVDLQDRLLGRIK